MPVISTIAAATARAFGAFKAAAGGAADEFFNYVTLLLHGDGTNGAQNNTFLDSSTNNFTITRNGNTTQGTFSPFSQDDGKWGAYFDGSGDDLTTPSNAAFTYGTSDFCVEGWFYFTGGVGGSGYSYAFAQGASTGASSLGLYIQGGVYKVWNGSAVITGTASFAQNTWVHLAVTRSGTTMRLFVNGTQDGSATNSNNITTGTTTGISIGRWSELPDTNYITGYVSNFRVVKGSAVYTSAFTPSTTPLTAISGTSLLTCQSNRFKDNSANNFAITVNGNTSIQPFSPFAPSAAYDSATNGASGYFDGSGDYLVTSSTQIIPTGSFTVECLVFVTGTGSNQKFVSQGSSGSAGRFSLGIEGGNWFVQIAGSLVQTGTPAINQWNYVAATYNGSTLTLYINGTSIGSISASGNVQNSALTIGQDWNSYTTTGYIGPVRISNTVRTVTSVPTAPFTSDGNTVFLCNFTNAGILDNTGRNDLETVGNAQISTSVKKFGTGSLAFDGTGDYLQLPKNDLTSFQTGDFTIECWLYLNANNIFQGIFSTGAYPASPGASNQGTFRVTTAGKLNFYIDNGGTVNLTGSTTVSTSTWHHVAVTRSGSTIRLFLNGTVDGSATSSASITGIAPVFVGREQTTNTLNGYIDDLRITKGVARYTSAFTPPTAAFEDQ